jgi:hypothetical protein
MPAPGGKKAQVISSFLVAAGLFVAANAALGKLPAVSAPVLSAESFQDSADAMQNGRPASWWITKSYLKQPAPDIVLFGSSQMGGVQAADAKLQGRKLDWVLDHECDIFEQAVGKRLNHQTSVFICGLPGAMVSDHYVISKTLFPHEKPGLVILTLAPRDFMDNFLPDVASTEPYKFYSRYLSGDSGARKLMVTSWNDKLQSAMLGILPLKNVSQIIPWKTISSNLPLPPQAVLSDDAMKQKMTGWLFSLNSDNDNVKPGQCIVLPNMPRTYIDNSVEYAKRYKNCNPPFYKKELEYLSALLKFYKQENIKVMIVDMPLTAVNRGLLPPAFWTSYKNGLQTACAENDAKYLDLSADQLFQTSDFVDTVHLNAGGGTKLIDKIADTVAHDAVLSACLTQRPVTSQRRVAVSVAGSVPAPASASASASVSVSAAGTGSHAGSTRIAGSVKQAGTGL